MHDKTKVPVAPGQQALFPEELPMPICMREFELLTCAARTGWVPHLPRRPDYDPRVFIRVVSIDHLGRRLRRRLRGMYAGRWYLLRVTPWLAYGQLGPIQA